MIREPNYSCHWVTPRRVTRSHHDRLMSVARLKTDLQPQELLNDPSASLSLHFNLQNLNSRNSASQAPGPSLVAGMSSDLANAGGEHEEPVASSLLTSALDESATALEQTSLTAGRAIDERKHSGTAPGACGPERDIFGALNFLSPFVAPARDDAPAAVETSPSCPVTAAGAEISGRMS